MTAIDDLADALWHKWTETLEDSDYEIDLRALARDAVAVGAQEFMAWCTKEKIVTLAGMGGARSRLDDWANAIREQEGK